MPGFQVDNACYETGLQATAAVFAKITPVAQHPWMITPYDYSEGYYRLAFKNVTDGQTYLQGHTVAIPPCQMLGVADAINVGWLIGGVWLSIFAISFLIRYFWGETQGTTHAGDS